MSPERQGGWGSKCPARQGSARAGAGRRGIARVQGRSSRAATHLSELEGRDDGDNDAHETDVEPIPVGQAGIGLSLQELEQHHPGRRHATPGGARARAAASTSRHSAAPIGPPRSGHSLRQPHIAAPETDGHWPPRRGHRFREPGAHALRAAEADPPPARGPAPPGSGQGRGGGGGATSATWRTEGWRAGELPPGVRVRGGSQVWAGDLEKLGWLVPAKVSVPQMTL